MTGIQVLALVAFGALVLALLLVLRGMGQIIARTRADEAFRRSVADIVGRAGSVLRGALEHADVARYEAGPLAELERSLSPTAAQLTALVVEMSSLQVPLGRRPDHDTVARDLGAASGALGALESGLGGDPASATERRIHLKRGYLALAHAARSLAEHGEVLATDRPRPDLRRRR